VCQAVSFQKPPEKLDVVQRASEDCLRGQEGRVVTTDHSLRHDLSWACEEIKNRYHPWIVEWVER
jgi:hypothetical protein